MAIETPISTYSFANGPERGTQLSLFGARLLHQGAGRMESIPLGAVAAVGVAYARDYRRIAGGAALILVALLLFGISGPLSGSAAEAAAEVSGQHSVAQLLRGTLHVLGVIAALLPVPGVAALLGGGAMIAFGWIGYTTLLVSLPAGERAYAVRGQSPTLVDFGELLAERVSQSSR